MSSAAPSHLTADARHMCRDPEVRFLPDVGEKITGVYLSDHVCWDYIYTIGFAEGLL